MRKKETDYAEEAKVSPTAPDPGVFARELGERVVRLREGRGWSRMDLARRLGVRRDRLAKWELGKHSPPAEMLVAFGKALGVSVDELVTGEPTVQGRLTPQQYEDLVVLLKGAQKVLREPGSLALPGGDAQGGRR